jgi:hypothetical protein
MIQADQWLKDQWAKVNQDLKTLWNNNRIFLILLIPVILIIKFRSILIDIIVNASKQQIQNAQNKDAKLKGKEDQANAQANQLVDEANKLGSQERPPVDADWYKKDEN